MLSCAFVGNRPSKFQFGYDEEHPSCVWLKRQMKRQITSLAERGVTRFFSGMALGAGIWGAEIVLELKETFPALTLCCVLPFEAQADRWPVYSRQRYDLILTVADKVVLIGKHYTDTCLLERNRYMADHAELLLAVYSGEEEGVTAATVRYAMRKEQGLILIHPDTGLVTKSALIL